MPSSEHSNKNRIDAILCAARRRYRLISAVEQYSIALALVLAGAVLMLLLGTQILAWYWLSLLAALGFASALLRPRSHPIPNYRLAQILDQRLKLSDTLSTAWFLLSQSRSDDPIARLQIERAEKLAGSVRVAAAFPMGDYRRWAVNASLAVLAISLFGVRYLVTDTLSLRPALVHLQFGPVLEALEKAFSPDEKKPSGSESARRSQDAKIQQDSSDSSSKRLEQHAAHQPGAQGDAAMENSTPASEAAQTAEGTQAGASAVHSSRQSASNGKTSQDSAQTSEQASMQPDQTGLLDKMKDAFSSLMAKLRPSASSPQAASRSEQPAQAQRSAEQSALGKGQSGAQQKASGEPSSEQQNAGAKAQGETAEKAQTSQARAASDSSEHQGSDKQAGIGRQDGDKAIKEAEQLQAMGKLAEIIGKRSANLTGDMTVETSSHTDALKTQYSHRLGRHADSGGEIDRDEIPLAYEQYVRDYMQEVRKQQLENPRRSPE